MILETHKETDIILDSNSLRKSDSQSLDKMVRLSFPD